MALPYLPESCLAEQQIIINSTALLLVAAHPALTHHIFQGQGLDTQLLLQAALAESSVPPCLA